MVALALPDPGQDRQADCKWQGIGKLPAQPDPFDGTAQRCLQLAALVADLGHAHQGQARERQWAAGVAGYLQRLLVGAKRRAQMAPGLPHLAKVAGRARRHVALTDCPLTGDDSFQSVLGLGQPAALPVGYRQEPVGLSALRQVVVGEVGEGSLPNARIPSASPRRRARSARASAIDAGKLATTLAAQPTDGS